MRDETVAKSYAETLFELAQRNEGLDTYGEGMDVVAELLAENPRFRLFLETPRIDDADKKKVVRKTFEGRLPRNLVNFLLVTIDKRRQRLLQDISRQFNALVDEHLGREHVEVTTARAVDAETRQMITDRLTRLLGKTAIPHMHVEPDVLGGIVVRSGNTIYDGSVRTQLDHMRRQLLKAELPSGTAA